MFSQIFYVLRSKVDGQYLVAHPRGSAPGSAASGYVLLFKEHFDALGFLNQHSADLADQFGVESLPGSQLENLLKRWGFEGMGVVEDPLLPRVEFLRLDRAL